MKITTFSQFLQSKQQLLQAIENVPKTTVEYKVNKYCSLVVGESEDEQQKVGLKPKHHIRVTWRYDNLANPTPESIVVETDSHLTEKFQTFWEGDRLLKWLGRHTSKE